MTGAPRLTAMRAAAASFVLVLVAALALGGTAHAETLKVGSRLAELDIAVDQRGKPFKLKALRGKWVLVTIGAEWCKPCAKELPAWDKLAPEWKDKVRFVAINIDNNIDDGKRFMKKLKIKNMISAYLPEEKSAVVAQYGSDTMPTTFVADGDGVVRYVKAGFGKDSEGEIKKMRETLTKLVGK
jgi:thiol-disulfide isomerase/thioredoxin